MYRKMISLLLTAALIAGMMPTAAYAAEAAGSEEDPDAEVAAEEENTDIDSAEESIAAEQKSAAAEEEDAEELPEDESPAEEQEAVAAGGESAEEETAQEQGNTAAEDTVDSETEESAVPAELPEEDIPELVSAADADIPDNDELFEGYVSDEFSSGIYTDCEPAMLSSTLVGSAVLTGTDLALYNILQDKIAQIADGTLASSRITIDVSDLGLSADTGYSADDLGVTALTDSSGGTTVIASDASSAIKKVVCSDTKKLLNALMADCPYEMYWFDKTTGWSVNIPIAMQTDGMLHLKGTITFSMDIADEYSEGTKTTIAGRQFDLTADTEKTGAAKTAAVNARAIISKYSAQSDYDKLRGYRDEILRLASYNFAAEAEYTGGDTTSSVYGNPWQLLWVFDGDSSTSVVCEGYSKAFQYLCEMSWFDSEDIYCLSVAGDSNGDGVNDHMWNIVRMDDEKNYLCDLTNSDSGMIGADGSLFLACAQSGSVSGGYRVSTNSAGTSYMTYAYSSSVLNLYGESWLELSETAYGASDTAENTDSVWVDEAGITCTAELLDTAAEEELGLTMPDVTVPESYTATPYCYRVELSAEGTLVIRVPELQQVTCLYCADAESSWMAADFRYDYYAADGYGILIVSGAQSGFYAIAIDEAAAEFIDAESGETLAAASSLATGEYEGAKAYLIDVPAAEIETDVCLEYSYLIRGDEGEESAAPIDGGILYAAHHGTTTIYVRTVHRTDNLAKCPAVSPDCTHAGSSLYYVCTDCGHYFTVIDEKAAEIEKDAWVIPALGHSFTDYVSNNDATCISEGTKTAYCDHGCGAKSTVTDSGSAVPHTLTKTGAVSATLWTTGNRAYWKCSTCGGLFADEQGTIFTTAKAITTAKTAPSLTSVACGANGVVIKWNAVTDATGYKVYRKTSGSSWSRICTTTSTSCTDKTALITGTTYYYTLIACSGSINSGYNTAGTAVKYVAAPKLTSAAQSKSTVTVRWSAVSGAANYAVYRKTAGSSWSRIGTTAKTSYADTGAKTAGTKYTYTVRAYVGGTWGCYISAGVSVTYLAAVKLNSAAMGSRGITVSWTTVKGAAGYNVYRKESGGSWSKIGTTTAVCYLDKTVLTNGVIYYYTVRATNGSGAGSYDTAGISARYVAAPKLRSAVKSGMKITVTWKNLSGATRYAVYRRTAGGSWIKLGMTTSASYVDTSAKTSGTTYYYSVRAVAYGVLGASDGAGVSVRY